MSNALLPREIARAAANKIPPAELAPMAAEVLSIDFDQKQCSDTLIAFARRLEDIGGLPPFVAMGAAIAAIEHESASRFVAIVTGNRPNGSAS